METVLVKKVFEDAQIPQRASNRAVGYDAFAYGILSVETDPATGQREYIGELPFELNPGEQILIGIGVQFASPWPIECQVRPRSGLANKHRIELGNSPGTVDPDFRGHIGILLVNKGKKTFTIKKGDRIAQLIFAQVEIPVLAETTEELPKTIRGGGGFGSTGLREIIEGTEEYWRLVREQDIFYMTIAVAASRRSNCARGCQKGDDGNYLRDEKGRLIGQTRRFGCVIVKNDNVISIGWNAQSPGEDLCGDVGCLRDQEKIPTGTQIERCRAIHAEQMAFTKKSQPTEDATMYVTAEPCEICARLIASSGFETLVVLEGVYPQNGLKIVKKAGINVRFVKKEDLN